MRTQAIALVITSSLVLAACSSLPFGGNRDGRGKAPPPVSEADAPAAEAPKPTVEATPGDAEKLETPAGPPRKRGFFTGLAKALGSDSGAANVGPCPAVRVLYDAQRFVELNGPERFENVGYTGEILNVNSDCRYVGEDPITINMQLDMAFGKGPKAAPGAKSVNYWVTVTRKDIAVISRQTYSQAVEIPAGSDRVAVKSLPIFIEIPRANKDIAGANFEVLVGFELTPDQLEFNRNGKRFRVDAGVPR
ncbi:hypothetical protein [Candidatus Phycosocius bacilliformis]|nr:hypothetical protein [Candidatus Phycosocius bacilliformis]